MKKFKYKRNNLQELFSEVSESLGWNNEININEVIKNLIQISVDKEFIDSRNSGWYDRLENKSYLANGSYPIYVKTNYGDIRIRKPRYRNAQFESQILYRYKSNYKKINYAVLETYLLGTSLRNSSVITQLFTGISFSHQSIANLLKKLDSEILKFHHRKINKIYKYIYLDGKYFKVKERGKVRKYDYYPMTPHQLCMFHKIANLNKYLNKKNNRKEILNDASNCYKTANSKKEFRNNLIRFKQKWQITEPRAVKCFSKDYDKTLVYFDFPKNDWHLISTNNLVERKIESISPKIRSVRYFQNLKSAHRIIGLLLLNMEGGLNLDMLPV